MRIRKIPTFVALAFALSACEEPTTMEVDVQPAFAAVPAACQGQITSLIASTWPFAHDGQVAFPPPPGAIALWIQDIGEPFFGISNVRELQAFFCGGNGPGARGPRATGSGHLVDTRQLTDEEPDFRNFAFTASGDGGQWQIVNRTFEVRLHGEIECLRVEGNQAWFAGHVTQSNDPDRIGNNRGFYMVDNGEGGGDPPDQIAHSTLLSRATPQQWCDFARPRPLFDIEQGNLQVR